MGRHNKVEIATMTLSYLDLRRKHSETPLRLSNLVLAGSFPREMQVSA
jgi:hypothetical protein